MAIVTVYSKPGCAYCVDAKEFLKELKIPYDEILLDPKSPQYDMERDLLVTKTGQKTFPFIFVKETFLGGYKELLNAHDTLRLHDILQKEGFLLETDF